MLENKLFYFKEINYFVLAEEEEEVVDPYDMLEPVEILSKLPKNFYDQIVSLMKYFKSLVIFFF